MAPDLSDAASETRKPNRFAQRLFRTAAEDELPLTIQHERIYILPSGRGMAFICVIAIMLMASINYGLNLGYALCFILIGLFAACLLATYKNLANISFLSVATNETFAGSNLQVTVRISEEANRYRSSIRLHNKHASTIVDAKPKAVTEAQLTIADLPRGRHAIGRLTLSSDFPLGLWRGWGYLHTPVNASIYPKPETPAAAFEGYSATAGGPAARRTGEQEFTGLKTYENSDSPSRVAWKQVASGAGWFSKQFEAEAEQQEIAIRWQDTPAHMGVEQRLSRMCAWVVRAKEENLAHTFELPGSQTLSLASGQQHYKACLLALANYQMNPADSAANHRTTPSNLNHG